MRRLFIMVLLVALAATVTYPQKKIRIRPAEKYSAKKKQDGVTLAVKPYHTVRETRRAFGTEMISTYGVLPILVVLHNSSSHILNLNTMKTRLITSDREGLEPLTEKELEINFEKEQKGDVKYTNCLLYTSPSPRDRG